MIKNTYERTLEYGVSVEYVSPRCYNTHMENELVSSVYTFVCDPDECDCLIQVTTSDGFGFPSGVTQLTCPCGRKTTLLSVVNATIAPSTKEKENPNMEQTLTTPYNPDLLVTYKKLNGYTDPEYITDKVRNIEWELSNARTNAKSALSYQNKIDSARTIILDAYQDSDDQEVLAQIADALDIELTKEITWETTIHATGTIQVSLTEDFDLESMLMEELTVEVRNGDIEVHDYEIMNCQEAY